MQDAVERPEDELRRAQSQLAGEHEARELAEAAVRRLQFLAEASAVLSSSLDYETTLSNVASLTVPAMADWCAVDLAAEGGGVRRVAVRHKDASKLELVQRIEEEYPSDPARESGVPHVIRTGLTEFVADIPDEMLVTAAADERHLEMIRALGLRSWLVLPLVARERVLGALTLVQAESGRTFDRSDIEFFEDVSRRAAVAIDNARLVRELEEAQRQLEEQSTELERQAEELEEQTSRLEEQTHEQRELLRELGRERSRLSAIFDHAPVGIVFAEAPSGRILFGNPAAERIMRHPVRYSANVDDYVQWEAYHADGRRVEGREYPLGRALRSGASQGPDEYLYHRGDGTFAWIRLTASPIRDEHGGTAGALVIIADIDAERRAVEQREQALQQAQSERALLGEIFENAPAVMALLAGPQHVIRMVNPQWERLVGRPGVLGSTLRDSFPEWEGSGLFELLGRVYETGEPYIDPEMAVPLQRASGVVEETYWNLIWLPLAPRDDGSRDILVHAIETTHQVRVRRQVHGLTQASLAVHGAVTLRDALDVVTEHARAVIGAHQAVTSMTVNSNWAQAISAVSLSEKYAEWRDYGTPPNGTGIYAMVCEANQPVRMTQQALEAHPRWRHFSGEGAKHPPMRGWLAAPLIARDGSNLGLIQLSDREHGDFTEDDEAVLVQLAQMASIAIENAQLYEAALDASRAKSDFLATMSHELRTPLNAMIGYSELLELGVPDAISPAARGQVERIRLAAQHLLQLIEEILTFSRVEAGRERVLVDAVSLHVLTDEVRAIIEPLAARKDLAFEVHVPAADVEIRTDPRKLRQVLLNLLGNAIKFTERGRVAFLATTHDDVITLEVQDTGIGMAGDDLARIYEPFWQAETAMHARSSGTGLGLPVSRQLIELLGGSIGVSSAPGVGTTFTVRLPLNLEPRD